MRLILSHPQSKPSTRGRHSTRGRSSPRVALAPKSHSSARVSASITSDASASDTAFIPLHQDESTSNRSTASLVLTIDLEVREGDTTVSDVDVEDDPSSCSSPRDDPKGCIQYPAAAPHDEDFGGGELERMLSSPSSSSSCPEHLRLSSPPIDVEKIPPLRDESPASSLLPSLLNNGPSCPERCGDHATDSQALHWQDSGAAISLTEHVHTEQSCEPMWRRAIIVFPAKEMDEEDLYTTFEYAVAPGQWKPGGDIAETFSSATFRGLRDLALHFVCPGFEGEDYDERRKLRQLGIIEVVRQLGVVLGSSLSGLKVTVPWPELTFPCVPDILAVILDSFPVLAGLHFADVQCECDGCQNVYTDAAKFKQLQLSAVQCQLSGPLGSTRLSKITIEKKSMHSLERDFTKYIGDGAHLAREALLGACATSPNQGQRSIAARSQDEAQFFVKLLKRDIPSATHFLVLTPELRTSFSDPALDLSGDSDCPEDELSDELVPEMSLTASRPQNDDSVRRYKIIDSGSQPHGGSDASLMLIPRREFDDAIIPDDVDWYSACMAMQHLESGHNHGSRGIGTEPPALFPPCLNLIPGTWMATSTFGNEEVSVAGPSSSIQVPLDQVSHPGHFWAPGNLYCGEPDVPRFVATDTVRPSDLG
uniref:N-acyl homoserine lactonase (AHL-lactonase) (Acyl-homoserine lactonase) (EC) n=1 Tax=Ganoderma boninense TaxID=34458 RepID=A0A5K1K0A1_9APHY|nr:N-acyl homoserine lactonase (AHL-lactonase) (Acyl-homoserine lactonase) (EC [Ganoderma boninense]